MIVTNKCPNVRIFPYKKGKATESFFMFPGINGSVPDTVAESPAFEEQKKLGLMVVVVPPSAEIKGDESRQKMRPDQIVKIGDLDVVATVLGLPEEKALELIPDITKEPTLELLKNKETRGSVLSAVTKQIETIKSMNVPKKENR